MNAQGKCAARMAEITPFYVMDLLARAKALEARGRDIVHMEVGEPDFSTPRPIIEAGIRALEDGRTHYTAAAGMPELREAIAGHYRDHHGVEISPGRIVVTPGASGALQLLTGVLVAPGDEVLLADPGYPCNRNFVHLAEGRPVSVPVGAESSYQLTPELVERHITPATRVVMLASPSNPTGTTIPAPAMAAIHGSLAGRDIRLIVDEIYHRLVYGEEAATALAVTDELFIINSFSKYFGMTGWRIGWLVAPEAYVEPLDRLAQNIFLSAPTLAQHAALAAFAPETIEILEQRRREFGRRRDFLLPALGELGFEIGVEPKGAFYLYADCSRFTDDSHGFCLDILERAGVAITPGKDFGRHRPETHVRFAYTTAIDRLEEGVERLRRYLVSQ